MNHCILDNNKHTEDGDDSDDDSEIAFAMLDFTGVDFENTASDDNDNGNDNVNDNDNDNEDSGNEDDKRHKMDDSIKNGLVKMLEHRLLFRNMHDPDDTEDDCRRDFETCLFGGDTEGVDTGQMNIAQKRRIMDLCGLMCTGRYLDVLKSESARILLGCSVFVDIKNNNLGDRENVGGGGNNSKRGVNDDDDAPYIQSFSALQYLQKRVELHSETECGSFQTLEAEIIAVASLNLFLQLNYTGPSLEGKDLSDVNPHVYYSPLLQILAGPTTSRRRRGEIKDEVSDDRRATDHDEKQEGFSVGEIDSTLLSSSSSSSSSSPITASNAMATAATTPDIDRNFLHNAVLSELVVDGFWPCQFCEGPYFLLLARAILIALSNPRKCQDSTDHHASSKMIHELWGTTDPDIGKGGTTGEDGPLDASLVLNGTAGSLRTNERDVAAPIGHDNRHGLGDNLNFANLWSGRAALAHHRLLQLKRGEYSPTLWKEVEAAYLRCINDNDAGLSTSNVDLARVVLEWGLAQHHFDRPGKGKDSFRRAMKLSGLQVEVTGSVGKRTKFQQKATAQLLVRAKSSPSSSSAAAVASSSSSSLLSSSIQTNDVGETSVITKAGTAKSASAAVQQQQQQEQQQQQQQQHEEYLEVVEGKSLPAANSNTAASRVIHHEEENILLERVHFENEADNVMEKLDILDRAILLSLCLDVKNDNPMDGLTSEQMGAYLSRVLAHHDDWMISSNALLERAWLEFEGTHTRERAVLQIQALVDQHTNRLTMTQSTFKSIEENSAPVQERLKNLHSIVYPPRWEIHRDLAERYAKLGAFTSAAELFEELELWDEVVECYRAAGKEGRAEQIVRERLKKTATVEETPRMWAALGDLTKDPTCYEKALELSHGKLYSANIALGRLHFEEGRLEKAASCVKKALEIKPLNPAVWFFYGTILMQLEEEDWDGALKAFSQVVQQEPEEGDAWANIAAVHMHNKNPSKAYPALVESLRQKRENWRAWWSKLYVCLDLRKFDEAIQACHQLIQFRIKKAESAKVPLVEEKCIRAIVTGTILNYEKAKNLPSKQVDDNVGDDVAAAAVAAVDSAMRTLDRVKGLLDTLTTNITEPWVWEAYAIFNERFGNNNIVLDNLMKEYRMLHGGSGWEVDGQQLEKIIQVAMRISNILYEKGDKDSLTKCKYLLNRLIKRIQAAHIEDKDVPEEVSALKEKMNHVEEKILKL